MTEPAVATKWGGLEKVAELAGTGQVVFAEAVTS
jgi:hypothetical protein